MTSKATTKTVKKGEKHQQQPKSDKKQMQQNLPTTTISKFYMMFHVVLNYKEWKSYSLELGDKNV